MIRKKILFITNLLQFPPNDGGSIKSSNFLRYLSKYHEITLLSFIRTEDELNYQKELIRYCREVKQVLINRSKLRDLYYLVLSFFGRKPFLIRRDYSKKMRDEIDKTIRTNNFDMLYADHLQMTQYVSSQSINKILDEHNIESTIVKRYFEVEKNPFKKLLNFIEYKKMISYEVSECKQFDLVLTVSNKDKEILANHGVKNISCFPIGVDTKEFRPFKQKKDSKNIVFLGTMYWPPNADAVQWFYTKMFPLVKQECPDSKLIIIGKRPPRRIRRYTEDENIKVLGFVKNLAEHLENCAVFVVPLRIGGGMRVKILNALSWGLPVVSTTVGAEGIHVSDNKDVLIRDEPDEFANAVIRLIKDYELRKFLSRNARTLAETCYDWDIIFKKMNTHLVLPYRSKPNAGI